jgi:lactam utilization protein B
LIIGLSSPILRLATRQTTHENRQNHVPTARIAKAGRINSARRQNFHPCGKVYCARIKAKGREVIRDIYADRSYDDNGELLCSLPNPAPEPAQAPRQTQFMRLPDYELQEITD